MQVANVLHFSQLEPDEYFPDAQFVQILSRLTVPLERGLDETRCPGLQLAHFWHDMAFSVFENLPEAHLVQVRSLEEDPVLLM